jgi:MATE family multidrug resistance protein
MNDSSAQRPGLTKHESASVMEILTISIPIMISAFSSLLMNFCDRVILAQHSTDAMNAGITAGMAANVFIFGSIGVALICEVFVGKRNGAGQFSLAASPAWQMVWFSVATIVIFVPSALCARVFVPSDQFDGMAIIYFKILMLFGPLFPMAAALNGFFIGIGQTKIVSIVAIIGNIINVVVDVALVFGVGDIIPALGIAGAAIGTVVAQALQVIILFAVFLRAKNREKYHTHRCHFDRALLVEGIKVGGPSSLGHMVEMAAWAIVLRLMAIAGESYITLLAFGQSMHMLFAFATEGIQKGVTTIAANMIGAGEIRLLDKLVSSALKFLGIVMLALLIPLVVYPDPIVQIFLLDEFNSQREIYDLARFTGILVWLYLFADGMVWIFAGILTAFSDTKFIMVVNALAAWFFALVPIYIFIDRMKGPPYLAWVLINLYAVMNAFFFWRRSISIRKQVVAFKKVDK